MSFKQSFFRPMFSCRYPARLFIVLQGADNRVYTETQFHLSNYVVIVRRVRADLLDNFSQFT